MKIINIFGPNLNMLGYRDQSNYGKLNFEQLKLKIQNYNKDFEVVHFQSNFEGEIIEFIHKLVRENFKGAFLLNLGAFTHYSYAISDALEMLHNSNILVEVHLSDVTKREQFRKISVIESLVDKKYFGKYEQSYYDAIDFIVKNENQCN